MTATGDPLLSSVARQAASTPQTDTETDLHSGISCEALRRSGYGLWT